jgi:hypothetical protein
MDSTIHGHASALWCPKCPRLLDSTFSLPPDQAWRGLELMERESEKGTSGVAIDLFSRINEEFCFQNLGSDRRHPSGSPAHSVVFDPEWGRSRRRSGAVLPPKQAIHCA